MQTDERIVELRNQLRKITTTKEYMVKLQGYLEENDDKLTLGEESFEKEHKDVEKLKHMSLTSILTYFKHDKEEILAKEEQEEIQAAFHVKQLQADRESLLADYNRCFKEISLEASLAEELQECLYRRARSDVNISQQVKELRDSLEKIQQEEKELDEAIVVGNSVLDKVQLALHDLSNASTWGTIDMFGGGVVSTMIKHNNLNNAQDRIADIRNDILRFEKELKDVQEYAFDGVEVSGGMQFADYVFDNFFTDFLVQSKIKNTQRSVSELADTIEKILAKLQQDKKKCEEQSNQLLKQYEDLLNHT